jgi:hypothetical protein
VVLKTTAPNLPLVKVLATRQLEMQRVEMRQLEVAPTRLLVKQLRLQATGMLLAVKGLVEGTEEVRSR